MVLMLLGSLSLAGGGDGLPLLQRVKDLLQLRELRIARDAPPISDAEYLQAAHGDVVTGLVDVPGIAAKKVYAVGVVDAPIERMWAAVNSEAEHPKFTQISYTELVDGLPCAANRKVFQYLPVPIVTDRWWISVIHPNLQLQQASSGQVRELTWTSEVDPGELTPSARHQADQGMPLAFTRGGWYLTALDDGRTLAEYYVLTDPGGSVPAGMASMFATGSVRDAVLAMGNLARSGPFTCPAR